MMVRNEFEALYGGAAGGGKSDYLIAEALRQVHIPQYRAVIFRRTVPELADIISRTHELYKAAFKRAVYNKTEHKWTFPSGAIIYLASMQHEEDKLKYQGRHFDFVGFDELTHFSETQYKYLFSRTRSSAPGIRTYIRATANPGGPGHGWVKSRFVSIAEPETTVVQEVEIEDPSGKRIKMERDRIFIPSSVFDNKILMENNPEYIASLAMLPEAEKKALLYGDWNSFSGQVFTEWKNDPENYETRQWTHVIEPFRIPGNWIIGRSYDFGYNKPFSVGWYATDMNGCIYRIRELYGCKNGEANVGIKADPAEQARMIREIEESDPNLKGRKIMGIADPSIFSKDRGDSIADIMAREGVFWSPGINNRIAGKMQYHYRMAFDKDGLPMFYVFNTCKGFIRTIPDLVYDEKNVEDIDTTQEDHIYDECRYYLMEYQIAQRENTVKKPPLEDPLDLYKEERKKAYRIIRI